MSETKVPANSSRARSHYGTPDEELVFLRKRVGELETQSQQLYQQAFLLQQRISTSDLNERERAEFISHVAHELRTPLTSIKGYIDLVLEGETGPINDTQRDFLSVVGLNAEKLSRIIGDLLDVSRLEAGLLGFKPDTIDAQALSLETCAQVRPQLEARGVEFEVNYGPGPLIASLDSERFSQALRAVLAHAGQITPPGKTVHFHIGRSLDEQMVEIRIEDEGPGIDKADLDRVFTKFWRPQNQTWREGSGPGLGLAIAKTIIDMHEGTIHAENRSEAEGGSIIILKVPLIVQPVELKMYRDGKAEQVPHYAALVVSKDAEFGRVVQQTLGLAGFQVIVAHDQAELVSDTPSWQPDLIINNGAEAELWGEVEGKQLAPALRGAAILTLSLSPVEQRVIAAGARAVLPWPATESLIVECLEQTIAPDNGEVDLLEFKQRHTILLVSPSSDSLRSLDKLVRDAGFTRVYRAMREADALTLARRYRPNWLLLDIPGELDGSEEEPTLFEMLRQDQLLSKTPSIIFLRPEQIAPDPSPNYQPTPVNTGRGRSGTGELRSRTGTGELGSKRNGTNELGARRPGTGELGGRKSNLNETQSRYGTDELKGRFYNVVPKPYLQRRLLIVAQRLASKR